MTGLPDFVDGPDAKIIFFITVKTPADQAHGLGASGTVRGWFVCHMVEKTVVAEVIEGETMLLYLGIRDITQVKHGCSAFVPIVTGRVPGQCIGPSGE